jgi:hypothetical protein
MNRDGEGGSPENMMAERTSRIVKAGGDGS